MNERFFLDTNIFVYSFDRTASAKRDIALELIRKAHASRKGVVSYQVVQEFFNVALRRFTPTMQSHEAQAYLKTVFLPLLEIHSSQSLYVEALNLQTRHHLAWYDSVIVASAAKAKCGLLLTEDLQHGRRFGDLQIENPFL
jgi:predicted nucleic acid-binding protein